MATLSSMQSHSHRRQTPAQAQALLQGPGPSDSGGGMHAGLAAAILPAAVGAVSLALRAFEAGANAMDRTFACFDMGG